MKKGKVLRLTRDLNCLQGSETKLKNEVEKLKADNIEKTFTSSILKVKFLDWFRPWRRHVKKP